MNLKFPVELADADIDAFVRALAEAESQRDANDEGWAGAGPLVNVYIDVEAEADELVERIDEFFDGFERLPENQSWFLKFGQRAADGGIVCLDGEDRPETRDVYVDIVRRNARSQGLAAMAESITLESVALAETRVLWPIRRLWRGRAPPAGLCRTRVVELPIVGCRDVELRQLRALQGVGGAREGCPWIGPTPGGRPWPEARSAERSAQPD